MEQLNIVGKRSGKGFVAHRAMLIMALSRALADRVLLMDLTIGRKGLLGYLKALGGSNIVKAVPDDGRVRVTCGANASYLADNEWIGEKTPMTICAVRVSPTNTIQPNVGALELAEAISRVLPFTATDDKRPVLNCVSFEAKEGKLYLVSADGFRLAVQCLDFEGEGQVLINRDDLRGIAQALKQARRVRVSFGEAGSVKALTIETDLIGYKWTSASGNYPDWHKLIPTEFKASCQFDTVEAIKAVSSIMAFGSAIDLTIGEGKVNLSNPDDKGQSEVTADTTGDSLRVRVDANYLAQALKVCGGMVNLELVSPMSPMLFSADGYQLVVMPMVTQEAQEAEKKAKAEAEPTAEPTAEKPKARRSRAKEPATAK